MKPQKQLFHHRPADGIYGDCARTAIACILEIDPEEVPHHHREMKDGEQVDEFRKWLARRDLGLASIAFDCDLGAVFEVMKVCNPGIHYILSGTSRTNVNHSVVCCGDAIVHDPSLTDAGIIGPCDNGYFYVEFIVRP